jgi:zinc and cadmium transporter
MFTTSMYAILSTTVLSLLSLLGVFALSMRKETFGKMMSYLLPIAAGAMLGNALFHLIPESFEHVGSPRFAGLLIASGFIGCFLLEKWLNSRCHSNGDECGLTKGSKCANCNCSKVHQHNDEHEHDEHDDHAADQGHNHGHSHKHLHPGGHGNAHRAEYIHPLGWMSLFSHTIHNFGDGAVIAVSYMISPAAGLATTFAFILHEIPMELGEFGVLVNAGFDRKRALLVNGLSGVVALIGTLLTLWIGNEIPGLDAALTPIGAGCVLYIATVGLLPQLMKEQCPKKSRTQFLVLLAAIAVMYFVAGFAA